MEETCKKTLNKTKRMKSILCINLMLWLSLAAFSQKDTVTTESGLKYVQIKAGSGPKPVNGQKLKVFYDGTLKDGSVFDSNINGSPFKFVLGKKEVIPGWDEGFKLMSAGEKGYLLIPSKLAYGNRGVENPEAPGKYIIPPGADLIFQVELVSFK